MVTSPGGVVMDSSGDLYGTTGVGGGLRRRSEAVFELVNSSGNYTEKVLYSFRFPSAGGVAMVDS